MLEMLDYSFMRNALFLSVLASVTCGIVGTLITVNRMSSFTGSIAHASFGGLGLAYLIGVNPMAGATVFALLASLGTGFMGGRRRMTSGASMSALWATGMAAGLVFIKLSGTYSADLMSWLFGSLLSVSRTDMMITGILGGVSLLAVYFFYREFMAISYDMEFARLQGIRVDLFRGLFLVLSALSVIVLMKVSGLIMVIALLTLPASIAGRFSRSLAGMMVTSSLLSAFFSVTGLFLSWKLDLPSGPVIILLASAVFFSVRIIEGAGNRS